MRRSYLLIIPLLIIILGLFASVNINNTDITIETNGTGIMVKTSAFISPPPQMKEEIIAYMTNAINDPDSTTDSIKADIKKIAIKYHYKHVNVHLKSQFGDDQLPMPAVVKGDSMYPTLKDGQQLIVLKTKDFKIGDIVVAKHPTYGLIVKRVGKIEGNRVYLVSDNKNVEEIYTGTSIITLTPLNTWLPKSAIIGVVKEII